MESGTGTTPSEGTTGDDKSDEGIAIKDCDVCMNCGLCYHMTGGDPEIPCPFCPVHGYGR